MSASVAAFARTCGARLLRAPPAARAGVYRRAPAAPWSMRDGANAFVRRSSGGASGGGGGSSGGGGRPLLSERNKKFGYYATSCAVVIVGLSYAAVPAYQRFCQATGFGGTTQRADMEVFKSMKPVPEARSITVHFNADVSSSMPWKFVPRQQTVTVVPGETALAFYTASNPTEKAITGVSTYNITPMKAGVYFQKIQCFCFEEQRLRPHEEIDMPVLFYIDPSFLKDPSMDEVHSLVLSYTFFKANQQVDADDKELAGIVPVTPAEAAAAPASAQEKVDVWLAQNAPGAKRPGVPPPAAAAQ